MTISIAILSDTHAHIDRRVLEIINQCDIAIHAGDICGEHVLEALTPKTGTVYAVAGNNDDYLHPNVSKDLSIDMPGGTIAVEHGHLHGMHAPCHQSMRDAHPNAKVIIYGHTHQMLIDKEQTPWVINPGAAGKTRTKGGPSCLILRCSEESWEVSEHRFPEPEEEK